MWSTQIKHLRNSLLQYKSKKVIFKLKSLYVKYLVYSPNLRKDRLSTPTSILGLFMSYVCFWDTVKIRTERSIIYKVGSAVWLGSDLPPPPGGRQSVCSRQRVYCVVFSHVAGACLAAVTRSADNRIQSADCGARRSGPRRPARLHVPYRLVYSPHLPVPGCSLCQVPWPAQPVQGTFRTSTVAEH